MALSTIRIAAGSLELAGSQKPRWGLRQPGSMPAEEDAVATAAEQGGVKAAGSGQKVEHGVPEAVLGGGSTRRHGGRGREDWPGRHADGTFLSDHLGVQGDFSLR